jgi:hypothetical protein
MAWNFKRYIADPRFDALHPSIMWGDGGTPNGVQLAPKGTLAYEFTGGVWYYNTDGVTAWAALGAGSTVIADTHGYYAVDTISGATDELALQVGGLTSSTFTFSEANVCTTDAAVYANLEALDLFCGDLASIANGEGASLIGIEDVGTFYAGGTVEAALQEIPTSASGWGITDGGTYYTTDTIDGALDAIALQIGGATDTTYNFTEANVCTDNTAVYANLQALDLAIGDLWSAAAGEGAALIGSEDIGTFYVGATVEAILQEIPTLVATWAIADGGGYYTTDTINGAFDALALQVGGLTDATFTFAEANVLANDDALYAALDKLDLKWGDLASVANGEGASLVATENVSAYYSGAANVEQCLDEIVASALGGASTTVRAYTNDYAVTDNETLVASIDALDTRLRRDAGTLGTADPGGAGQAIPVTESASIALTIGAGAETNGLAAPAWKGQTLSIYADSVGGGSRAITSAVSINQATNTVMTFAAARDFIKLEAITVAGGLVWQVIQNDGVALS